MKIALVTETFPPEVNGVAMTLLRLVNGLAKRGHVTTVIRPKPRQKQDEPKVFKDVHVLGLPIPGYGELQFGRFAGGLIKKELKKNRPDVMHVATEGPLGFSAVSVAREMGIPCVSSFHTNFQSYTAHYGVGIAQEFFLRYMRWLHNRTLATFAPSIDVVEMLEEARFENVKILGRGVDTELFGPHRRNCDLRREWGADDDTPVVIYVGRIASEKNIPLTIKAFQLFQKRHPAAKFVLVGDGPEKKDLQKLYPDFYFAGVRRDDDLARYYASADLFFFGSVTETFGNVITEAMASRLVVLAYDYAAGKQYIVDGENGYKCKFGDETQFLATVDAIASGIESWQRIRENAYVTAQGLSWDAILEGYERDLMELLSAVH